MTRSKWRSRSDFFEQNTAILLVEITLTDSKRSADRTPGETYGRRR